MSKTVQLRESRSSKQLFKLQKQKGKTEFTWVFLIPVYVSPYISQQSFPTYFDPIKKTQQHHGAHHSLIQPVCQSERMSVSGCLLVLLK